MGNLTLKELARIAEWEVGVAPGGPLEMLELANQAGQHLMGAVRWQWAEGRSLYLRPRASISIEGATWTEGTLTLEKTGAFAGYEFLSFDTVEAQDGTGVEVGTYVVASNPDDDTIILESSIGAAADGQTDIEVELPNDQIALPTDFDLRSITAWDAPNGLVGYMEFTGSQEMLSLRSFHGTGSTVGFWALLRHVRGLSGGQPIPRLELWPRTASDTQAMVINYTGGWKAPATDDEVLSIPDWLNLLYVEVFKAVVMGHEEPENGTVDERLTRLRMSPEGGILWRDALARDNTMQTSYGSMNAGWMDPMAGGRIGRYDLPTGVVNPPL